MYTIRYEREIDLLDITWSGLFTPQDMARYDADCRDSWKREGFTDGYRLRIDLNDVQALPQDTLAALSKAFVGFPVAGRIAMVTGSAIARLQIKRAMPDSIEILDTPQAALDWLLAS